MRMEKNHNIKDKSTGYTTKKKTNQPVVLLKNKKRRMNRLSDSRDVGWAMKILYHVMSGPPKIEPDPPCHN